MVYVDPASLSYKTFAEHCQEAVGQEPNKSLRGDTPTIGGGMAHGVDNQVAAFRYIGTLKDGQLKTIGKVQ